MNYRKRSFIGKTKLLSELCDGIIDCHHSTPKWTESGKLVIRNFNIKKGKLNLNDLSFTNEETYKERIKRKKPEAGDLIITREAPMGEVCIIPEGLECCLGQRMVLLKPNKKNITGKYLLYALQSEFVQIQILKSDKTGSIVSNLRIPVLEELNIPVFDVISENKIGSLLSDIDSKIELNNLVNNELEAMAKTLYFYWFVQFDFPDKNGKPYKTSGGKMVWNNELKREIPEGWQVIEMSKLLVKNNVKYDYKGFGFDTIDLSVMPSSTMCLTGRNHSDSFSTNLFYLKKFDILFGAIRPYLLKAGFAPFDGLVTGTVHSYRTIKKDYYNFALLTMIQESVFKHAISNSKGTKMPVIGSDDLLGYKVPFDEGIIIKFNESFSFKEIIAHNINENQKLTELRDWLLPMLMNGQVKVN